MRRAFGGLLVLGGALLGFGCGSSDDSDAAASELCHDGCVAVLAADCDNGPARQAQCESDCSALESGSCATQYKAVQTCAKGKAITCNSAEQPTIAACSSETSAFVACIAP